MSLPRSPLGAELRRAESNSSLAIDTEHISHSLPNTEEEIILRQHALQTPLDNSHEETRIDPNLPFISSPAIAGTGSQIHNFVAPPQPSDTLLNTAQHPARSYLPVASAVDSTAYAREPLYIERPLSLPGVHFSHQESFGNLARDFIEANRLARYEIIASKMATMPLSNNSTLTSKGGEVLSVKPASVDEPPSYLLLPRLRTGAPSYEMANREIRPINQASHKNGSSAATVIIPGTQIFGPWPDRSDFSFDGMSVSMKNRDTADNLGQHTTDQEEISPTSHAPPEMISDSTLMGRRPLDEISETSENESPDPEASITGTGSDKNRDRDNNAEGSSVPVMEPITEPTFGEANNPVSPSHAVIPGVPQDITGELPPPGLQPPSLPTLKLGKRKRLHGGVQKSYRKVRTALLQRKVLDFIVGRQLGKSTRDGLWAISKGLPVNIVVNVTDSEPDSLRLIPS